LELHSRDAEGDFERPEACKDARTLMHV